MELQLSGLLGVLILVADIWAILNIVQSNVTTVKKLLWILVILLLPALGLLIWWLAGPREVK